MTIALTVIALKMDTQILQCDSFWHQLSIFIFQQDARALGKNKGVIYQHNKIYHRRPSIFKSKVYVDGALEYLDARDNFIYPELFFQLHELNPYWDSIWNLL